MNGLLQKILHSRKAQLERQMREMPFRTLTSGLQEIPSRPFDEVLKGKNGIHIIAEIKRASPTRGNLNKHVDPVALSRTYERGGATAISVLTEVQYFLGSFDDLTAAKIHTHLPVLCKDFVFDPYQVYQARRYGADAILLILSILQEIQYVELHSLALEIGLIPVVEIHDVSEIETALRANVRVLAVNRRNLETFSIDTQRTETVIKDLPTNVVLVAESAIQSREEVHSLHRLGYDACLVGEALARSDNPEGLLKSWINP